MKKWISLFLAAVLMTSAMSGCGGPRSETGPQNDGDTEPEVAVTQEATEEREDSAPSSSEEDVVVLDEFSLVVEGGEGNRVEAAVSDAVAISFDGDAFSDGATVRVALMGNQGLESPDMDRFSLGTKGYDFSLEGSDYVRPNGPISVTIDLDEEMVASLEDESFFQLAYYYEKEWYLQDADEVDLAAGTATFTLHHFSWFFDAKLTKEEIREQTAQQMAEKKFNDDNNLKRITRDGRSDLEKTIAEATGVTDTKAIQAVAEYILNDDDFTSLMLSGAKEDYTGFSTKMAEMMAKKMNSAATIGSNATLIAGAFQAAGYAWELDGQGAAEAISHAILDSNPYGKLLKLSITVTDESIKSWKKNGIEEMYQAYKNGADEGWFGYNVEKGDFGEALSQSAAIERQVGIDAVKRYCFLNDKQEDELSASQLEEIKKEAIDDLENSFKERVQKEAEIQENKTYYKNLLDAFENNKVDDSVTIKVSMMDDLPYDQRLESYKRVTDRLLAMTGKKIEFDGLIDDTEIPIDAITSAIKMWYEEDGENKVKAYFKEKGYLPTLAIEELAGNWAGTMTITEVYLDEGLVEQMKAELPEDSEDGCDLIDLEDMILQLENMEGETQDISAIMNVLDSKTMAMTTNDQVLGNFAYDPVAGTLTMISGTSEQDGFDASIGFKVIDGKNMTGSGTMTSQAGEEDGVTYEAGLVKLSFTMTLVKD